MMDFIEYKGHKIFSYPKQQESLWYPWVKIHFPHGGEEVLSGTAVDPAGVFPNEEKARTAGFELGQSWVDKL